MTAADVYGQEVLYYTDGNYFSVHDRSHLTHDQSAAQGGATTGTLRYAYFLPDLDRTYTVIGIQEGGRLTYIEAVGFSSVRPNAGGAEGILDTLRMDTGLTAFFLFAAAVIAIFFGIGALIVKHPVYHTWYN